MPNLNRLSEAKLLKVGLNGLHDLLDITASDIMKVKKTNYVGERIFQNMEKIQTA